MTRKKLRLSMIIFAVISVSVLVTISIFNFKSKSDTNGTKPEVAGEGIIDDTKEPIEGSDELVYFVNENLVEKRVSSLNEVILFEVTTKLIIENKGEETKTIDPDLFKISYDTKSCNGLLFNIDYGEIEKPIILQGKSSTSINFKVQYILQDTKNSLSLIEGKSDLKFNYADNQIYVCQA